MKTFLPVTIIFFLLLTKISQGQNFTLVTSGIGSDLSSSFGAAWGDYDNDGDNDIFITTVYSENDMLFKNNGNGSFTSVTVGALVTETGFSEGAAWGDFDNDGDLDLFVAFYNESNVLYSNNGDGTFTQVSSGLASFTGASGSVSWADINNDGDLDLFVGIGNGNDLLYINNGDGTFTRDFTSVIANDGAPTTGNSWADYDGDGDIDLFVATTANDRLYRNNNDSTFTLVTGDPVVSDNVWSNGGSWGDYDNDGDLDLFVTTGTTNSALANRLYKNNGNGGFTRITTGSFVTDLGTSMSGAWADYDNDGWLDLFVANTSANGNGQNDFLYHNNADGTFTRITTGVIVTDNADTRGAAWADYDTDGDLDLYVSNEVNQTDRLYQNNGNSNHYISIRTIGTVSNRSSIGAIVRVKATINGTSMWQMRDISSQTGYFSQNSLEAEFGLGDATMIDSIVVRWPSGITCIKTNVAADQFITITESCILSGVEETITNAQIAVRLIPNPAKGETMVTFSFEQNETASMQVHDMLGNLVYSANKQFSAGAHSVKLDVSGLAQGTYIFTLRTANGAKSERLIVIQ